MVLWPRQCSIPETSEIHFLGPDLGVEALTPILVKDQCVGMIDNGAQAIIDEVASDSKAQEKSNQGNYGDPFLPWVFDCLPRVVDLALLHTSRTEIFLVLLLMVDVNGRRIFRGAQRGCVERVPGSGADIVTTGMACRLDGTTSVGGLLWSLIW